MRQYWDRFKGLSLLAQIIVVVLFPVWVAVGTLAALMGVWVMGCMAVVEILWGGED